MDEIKYMPRTNLHNKGYIDMYVTNGIEIEGINYIIVEYKVIGQALYAILTRDFQTYYKQLLTGISEQEYYDDTAIIERITRLENIPPYRYDDTYLRGKVEELENHNTESESTIIQRLEILENHSGSNGKSAYEIWLDQGNTGTEQYFIDSLKGVPGIQGTTFTPHISDENVLSWTNDGGLSNPDPVTLATGEGGSGSGGGGVPDEGYTKWIYCHDELNKHIGVESGVYKNQLDTVLASDWTGIKEKFTIIFDRYGTLGFVNSIDRANDYIMVHTVTSKSTSKSGMRLGTLEHASDLPTTITDLTAKGWSYADQGDFVYVLEDENHSNGLTEYYIDHINRNTATVSWMFSHAVNTGNYQLPTETNDSGKLLIGGISAGTFGESIPVNTFQRATTSSLAGKILTGGDTPGTFGEPFDPTDITVDVDELTEADVISIWNSVK